jgi:RimJ/RimL family protein N-acetyltransferase
MDLAQFRRDCTGPFEGKYIRLQRLNPEEDYEELYEASHGTAEKEAVWTYLFEEPAKNAESFKEYLIKLNNDSTWVQFVVVDKKSNRKIGQINYLSVVPAHKRGELGGVWYTPEFHGTYANPESTMLLLFYLFDKLKYRRAEWKCNANNIPSGKAAAKLGFTEEGVFRQHMVIKGVNRDTRWFSMLDCEWEDRKKKLFTRLSYTEEDEKNLYSNN